MDKNQIEQLKKLAKIFNLDSMMSADAVQEALKGVLQIMLTFKKESQKMSADAVQEAKKISSTLLVQVEELSGKLSTDNKNDKKEISDLINSKMGELNKMKDEILNIKPQKEKEVDENLLIDRVLGRIKMPEIKEVVLDGPEEIADKLESLEEDDRLDASAIKGLEDLLPKILTKLFPAKFFKNTVGGGVQSIVAGTGINISASGAKGKGVVTINATAVAGTWNEEYPASGVVNGSNKVFVFTHTPAFISLDGQTLSILAGDYTVSVKTVTLLNAPLNTPPINKYLS